MVDQDKIDPSSSSSKNDFTVEKMFDRMKSFNTYRIGSNPGKTFQDAKESTTCWIKSTTLGIIDKNFDMLSAMTATSTDTNASAVPDVGGSTTASKSPSKSGSGLSLYFPDLFKSDTFDLTKYINREQASTVILPSFAAMVEQLISDYLVAMTVGAAVGAAVATGVSVGLVAMSGMLRISGVYVPALYQWIFPTRTNKGSVDLSGRSPNSLSNAIIPEKGQSTGESQRAAQAIQDSQVSVVHQGPNNQLILMKAVSNSTSSSSLVQCRACLNSVGALLSKQDMSWSDVKRISAFLVTDRCDGYTFRQALSEYPWHSESTILSLMFVQRLEQENSIVEVEVLAAKD